MRVAHFERPEPAIDQPRQAQGDQLDAPLTTSRRKIDVFGPLVNGGGKAKPAGWPAGGGSG